MARTKHFKMRMIERSIREDLLQMVLKYGSKQPDGKVVLNRKGLLCVIAELRRLLQIAQQGLKREGLVVAMKNDVLITTYGLETRRK